MPSEIAFHRFVIELVLRLGLQGVGAGARDPKDRPNVLRVFLPTCSPAQVKQMFGPVDAFLAESETGDAVCIYRLNGEELSSVQRKIV